MKIQELRHSMCDLDCTKNKDPNYMLLIVSLTSELQNLTKLFMTLS